MWYIHVFFKSAQVLCVEAWAQHWVCSTVALYLVFVTGCHWTWRTLVWLGLPDDNLQDAACLCVSTSKLHTCAPGPGFYMRAGDPSTGHHACMASPSQLGTLSNTLHRFPWLCWSQVPQIGADRLLWPLQGSLCLYFLHCLAFCCRIFLIAFGIFKLFCSLMCPKSLIVVYSVIASKQMFLVSVNNPRFCISMEEDCVILIKSSHWYSGVLIQIYIKKIHDTTVWSLKNHEQRQAIVSPRRSNSHRPGSLRFGWALLEDH